MGFYEQISKYYDDIFPASKKTVDFIASVAGETPKEVLDVACGTGGHSLELAKRGYNMTSTDLDEKMILELKRKAKEQQIKICSVRKDMLEISGISGKKFDVIFCIGNSIVHLNSNVEIQSFFKGMYNSLAENGKFIVQIVNFDKIFTQDCMTLPLIQNDEAGIQFERNYKIADDGKIDFATTLSVDNSSEKFTAKNQIQLIPVCSGEVADMLEAAGFSKIKLFGDFYSSEYDPKGSNAVIAVAQKTKL